MRYDETKINPFWHNSKHSIWLKPGTVHHMAKTMPLKHDGSSIILSILQQRQGDWSELHEGWMKPSTERSLNKTSSPVLANQQWFTFQHEIYPKHTVKKTMGWLKDKSIIIFEGSIQSPNLNPIEHLCRDLKLAVQTLQIKCDGAWPMRQEQWMKLFKSRCAKLIAMTQSCICCQRGC